jgi:hypothetical protein
MKKSLYLTIIWSITIVCILIGSGVHIFHWISGVSGYTIPILDEESGITQFFAQKKDTSHITFSEDLEELKNIKLDLSAMDVTLQTGSQWHLEYKCDASIEPSVSVNEQTLIMTQPDGKNVQNASMILTIPEEVENVHIDAAVGDIRMTGIVISGLLEADAAVGDITLKDCGGNITLSAEVGDIFIEGSAPDRGYGKIEIDSSLGDVNVNNTELDELTVDSALGDIAMLLSDEMKENRNDYSWQCSTDMGDIRIDGKSQKNTYSANADAEHSIVLTASMGDIVVE